MENFEKQIIELEKKQERIKEENLERLKELDTEKVLTHINLKIEGFKVVCTFTGTLNGEKKAVYHGSKSVKGKKLTVYLGMSWNKKIFKKKIKEFLKKNSY